MRIPFTNWQIGFTRQRSENPALLNSQLPKITGAALQPPAIPGRGIGRRSYAVAQVSRLTADWPVTISSANAEIQTSLIAVRSRNRQLERDNDYFRRMLRLVENNVVGHAGVKLQMKVKDSNGKLDKDANTAIETAWKDYLKPKNCTVMRNMSGVDLERLVVRRMGPDGGLIIRKRRGFDNKFRFAVEPLELDRLNFLNFGRNPKNGNQIQFGIEFDPFNAPVAYWILAEHPGDVFSNHKLGGKTYQERVPEDEIMFIAGSIERAGQLMPMPLWCSVASRLNMLGRYEEAEQVAARVGACKGGFFTKKTNGEGGYPGPVDEQGNKIEDHEPGMMQELPADWDFKEYNPNHPNTAFNDFVKGQIRGASSGSNLSSHAVGNDLSDVNYSSIRAGTLEDREEYKTLQTRVIDYLMDPWFEDWLPFAILSGQIDLPIAKKDKFNAATWCPRRWPWVDPAKDISAAKETIAMRLDSRRSVIEEQGKDMEEVDAEFAADPILKDLPIEPAYIKVAAPPAPADGFEADPPTAAK